MASASKPTLVRIKRKRSDDPLDCFLLERTEQHIPKKLDSGLAKLSLNDQTGPVRDVYGKVLFYRSRTVPITATYDPALAKSLMVELACMDKPLETIASLRQKGRREMFKRPWKLTSKERHEQHSLSERLKQVWKSRNQKKEDRMHQCFHIYDVEMLDVEDEREKEKLSPYLELLADCCPEYSGPRGPTTRDADEYVYDMYIVSGETALNPENYVTVKVCEEPVDYLPEGPWREINYDSEDSNDEAHPDTDYPQQDKEDVASESDEDKVSSVDSDSDEDSDLDDRHEFRMKGHGDDEVYNPVYGPKEIDSWMRHGALHARPVGEIRQKPRTKFDK